ncbi:MAG: AhpC/TSA family protein [Chitinophagaceae bacterium]|nr:AhpC/TSA family protein [Chitinophagaceae bacterium]
MKKGSLVFAVCLPLLSLAQTGKPTAFTITGSFKQMKDTVEWVYLYYIANNNRITDSTKVVKGKYTFKGEINEPTVSRLRAKYKGTMAPGVVPRDFATLFLQPAGISITNIDSFSNIIVKGAAAHDIYKKFETLTRPFSDSMQSYYQQYGEARQANDMNTMRLIEAKAETLEKNVKETVLLPFIKNNSSSPVALMALQQYAGGYDIDIDQVEPLFNSLSPEVRQYPSAAALKERIDITKRTAIGQLAADFTQNDTLDNPVKLSSLRGKYLLVDFWASWCGPCRQENPNVVSAYHKYKDKGFYVLGVSLDRPGGKDAWIKAIHDDNLTWTHVSDLQFWNNAVAKLYGIQSIPQNLLLDPSGKIISKNLRGAELHARLEEVLGK